ncbi:MAG: uncharacterized protein QOF18_1550 [Frankiaceae bacterium]|nr:uncharacterized protein [Frankiaceae bacterium]
MDETSELTRRILEEFGTITVVGLSSDPTKAAHSVPAAMQAYGWRIIPVNPHAEQLLDEVVYRRLADIPEPVDVVNVFRPSAEAADVAWQAAEVGAKALWLQLGISSDDARRIAADAGMLYVEDRCLAVERARHAVHRAA